MPCCDRSQVFYRRYKISHFFGPCSPPSLCRLKLWTMPSGCEIWRSILVRVQFTTSLLSVRPHPAPLPSLFPLTSHRLSSTSDILPQSPLPGSHNSASFSVDTKFGIGEFSPVPAFLGFFFVRWSKCHSHDLYEQLKRGVRYIDLRVCRSHIDNELRTEHTVYGEKLEPLLGQIKRFIDEHPTGEKGWWVGLVVV